MRQLFPQKSIPNRVRLSGISQGLKRHNIQPIEKELMRTVNALTLQVLQDRKISEIKYMAFRDQKIKRLVAEDKMIGMTKICAWCGKSLGSRPDQVTKKISHGICLSCARGFLLKSHLDTRHILHD